MIALDVWPGDRSGASPLGTISEPHEGFSWSTELDGDGGGTATIDADSADGTLLQAGRLVVVRDGATELAAWFVERFGAKVGNAWIADAVSGPGVRSILDHALVEPEYGLERSSSDQRWFGPMARAFDDSAWATPNSHGTYGPSTITEMADPVVTLGPYPETFPDNTAEKLWSTTSPLAPAGVCHFRRVVDVPWTEPAPVKVYATAVGELDLWIDGDQVISSRGPRQQEKTFEAAMMLGPGEHTIYARVNKLAGSGSRGWFIMSMQRVDAEGEPIGAVYRTHTWVGHPSPWKILAYPADEPGMTVGEIAALLLEEADTRGELGGLFHTIDPTFDHVGGTWRTVQIGIGVGATLSQAFGELGELGFDYDVLPSLYLRAWTARGIDRSGTVDLTVPGRLVGEPSLSRIHKPRTRLLVKTASGWGEVEKAAAVATHGRRSGFLSLGGMATSESAADYISEVLDEVSEAKLDSTVTIDPDLVAPYTGAGGAFDLGDTVVAPAHRTPGGAPMRVLSIAGEADAAGIVAYSLELGA